ncbi:MAG TPA: alpha-glucosidase [Acidobacteriaceae bacterium]
MAFTRTQHLLAAFFLCTLVSLGAASGHAQMLARPGWSGSGMAAEPWWKHAVIYEIYPRSFQDSNGDGVGDLKGITQRLDYLQSLGIDAIWLTPIYPSPQVDFGYDISDYTAIDPQYGTMEDFDVLVREAGRRNIRILMDMVMNHTSDQHPWFKESRSNRTNPKRDWYIWHDGSDAAACAQPGPACATHPPNNWLSLFGHSSWQYDESTNQFFYHQFYPQQPDLNWRNPAVEKAMFDAVRFWLNRGVAGFRLDAVLQLYEDPKLTNAQELPGKNSFGDTNQDNSLYTNLPEIHGMLRDLRKVTDSAVGQRVLVGETYANTPAELATMYGSHHDELQLPMDTQLAFIDKLDAAAFRTRITNAETKLNGNQPLILFDNHDNVRSWDRYSTGVTNPQDKEAIARVLATVLLTTRAAAQMYYGQELGMVTTPPTRKEDVKDPIGIIGWPENKGRDGERTPMQWDARHNAGFTVGTPWLPVPTASNANVAAEDTNPDSLLNWYRKLIALRRSNPALASGSNVMLNHDAQNALVWVRKPVNPTLEHPAVVIACNLSGQPVTLALKTEMKSSGIRGSFMRTIARTDHGMGPMNLDAVHLPPYGVYIGEIRY